MDNRATSEEVEALARQLFRADDPGGVFEAADYAVQAHYRREAAVKLEVIPPGMGD